MSDGCSSYLETVDRAHLNLVVVGVDIGPHFDFLNLDDLLLFPGLVLLLLGLVAETAVVENLENRWLGVGRNLHEVQSGTLRPAPGRSEEHTSELQSLMRISYAVFCLKKKKTRHKSITRMIHKSHTTKKHIRT